MVSQPEFWVKSFAEAGANMYNFHLEASADPSALINTIHSYGMQAGISVKPKTLIDAVFPFCDKVDMVLVMTVEPGFGGQIMMPSCLEKASILRSKFPNLNIQVDGGITLENIDQVAQSGANVVVSGTGIFKSPNAKDTISMMRNSMELRINK